MFDDPLPDDLADELRRVPPRAGLRERLLEIAGTPAPATAAVSVVAADATLDAALRDVTIPRGLQARLLAIAAPRRRTWRETLHRVAVAAAVLAAWALWWGGTVASLVLPLMPAPRVVEPEPILAQFTEPSPLVAWNDGRAALEDTSFAAIEFDTSAIRLISRQLQDDSPFDPSTTLVSTAPGHDRTDPRPWAERVLSDTGLDAGAARRRLDRFLADATLDERPELARIAPPPARGIDAPLDLAGRLFLLDRGVFPRVSTQAFAASQVPLSAEVGSYERALGSLRQGEWPAADQVRTEELVAAAAPYSARPVNRPVTLTLAAGPVPWQPPPATTAPRKPGEPATPPAPTWHLVQIEVQTRDLAPAPERARHVVLAVDTSASMGVAQRLERARQALDELLGRLGPQDQVSLVAFGDRAETLVEGATLADREALRAAIRSLAPGKGTNLGSGLWQAIALASRSPTAPGQLRAVIALTDGLSEVDPRAAEVLETLLAERQARGVRLDVLDLAPHESTSLWLEPLVTRTGGRIHPAPHPAALRAALWGAWTRQPQVAACEAQLTVSFNSAAVSQFRVLGHEPTVVAGLEAAPWSVDLVAGQSVPVLYEVEVLPNKEPELATARLTWRDPRTGESREATGRLLRTQVAGRFHEAPASWQWSATAAAAAELLRGSPFAGGLSWSALAEAARPLRATPSPTPLQIDLLELIDRAERLATRRGPGRAGAGAGREPNRARSTTWLDTWPPHAPAGRRLPPAG